MSSTLFENTPTVAVRDNRGSAVRMAAYHRVFAGDQVEARVARQIFDTAGHMASSIDPRLFAAGQMPNVRQSLTLSGWALRVDSVDAGVRAVLRDVRGLPVWAVDGKGQSRRVGYDALGRAASVHERSGNGAEGCRERRSYGEGAADAAERNVRGRLIHRLDTAGERSVGCYGLNGEPLRDETRFLKALDVPDWPVDEAEMAALLETETYPNSWRYGASGEMLQHVDAAGHARRWLFDAVGQLKSALLQGRGTIQATVVQSEMVYDADGALLSSSDGGVAKRYEYEASTRRLTRQTTRREGDGTVLQDLKYGYDPVGNVTSIEDASQPTQYFRNQKVDPVSRYAYDALYQLIEAKGRESAAGGQQGNAAPPVFVRLEDAARMVNYTRQYAYDAGGNLFGYSHRGAAEFRIEMIVSAVSNRAMKNSVGKAGGNVENGFDGNGNLRQLEAGQPLEWDARNQLMRTVQVEHADGTADDEVYVYDGDGLRVRKIRRWQAGSQWQTEEARYLVGLELRERRQTNRADGDAKITQRWQVAMQGGARLLRWAEGLPDGVKNGALYYAVSDHLGSNALELDDTGHIVSREEYYPYGATALWAGRSEVEADYKTIRYSGKERDETGLYYYGLRYYAPWLMRWLNADPAGTVDGPNLFRMVGNNPTCRIDPDGACWEVMTTKPEEDLSGWNRQMNRAQNKAGDLMNASLMSKDRDFLLQQSAYYFNDPGMKKNSELRESIEKTREFSKNVSKVTGIGLSALVSYDSSMSRGGAGGVSVINTDNNVLQGYYKYQRDFTATLKESSLRSEGAVRHWLNVDYGDDIRTDYKIFNVNHQMWSSSSINDKDWGHRSGLIIHEFSHAAVNTFDYTYGVTSVGYNDDLHMLATGELTEIKGKAQDYMMLDASQAAGGEYFQNKALENAESVSRYVVGVGRRARSQGIVSQWMPNSLRNIPGGGTFTSKYRNNDAFRSPFAPRY